LLPSTARLATPPKAVLDWRHFFFRATFWPSL
jgi:hypothetical protein